MSASSDVPPSHDAISSLRNFISSGNDNTMQETLAKLKLISHISTDKVLDTKRFTLSERGYLASIYRTIFVNNQSRTHAHKFFSETINSAFMLAFGYIDSNDIFIRNTGEMILAAIKETIPGLENHKNSYPDDIMHGGRMAALIGMINTKLDTCKMQQAAPFIAQPIAPQPSQQPSQQSDQQPTQTNDKTAAGNAHNNGDGRRRPN